MENLGPYKLESVIGRGGMGTVYKATNQETGDTHAVKVLAPVYSTDDHFRNRFESEIKALLRLHHPNIVQLVSYGQDDHNLYFAMELVEGQSLFQLQRDGTPFHWREVIRIAKNVALGLRHAHDRGVIHRDLKPGNLLKANSGIVKITDFGIAKRFGQNQNTGTNVLGTLDFMSPEQAKGQPVTVCSDLYGLGSVMYTLLAGRPPFTANSFEESMRNLTKVPAPRIIRLAPDVPEALDELIARLLAKKPEERVQTALSLYHQLKQVEQELLNTSQAKTAERFSAITSEKALTALEPSTSVDQKRGSGNTLSQHDDRAVVMPDDPLLADSTRINTAAEVLHSSQKSKFGQRQQEDFYTAVPDAIPAELTKSPPERAVRQSLKVKLGLFALLLTVLLAGIYGIVRVNRVPTAEVFLNEIESNRDRPHQILEMIGEFLKHYPHHERSAWVTELRDLAPGIQKVNFLAARRNRPGLLSNIEKDFLKITDSVAFDAPKALNQMNAFINLYKNDKTLDAKDYECVQAAKSWLKQIERDAAEQIQTVRQSIERQLNRAAALPKSEAMVIYDSIIELNQSFEWATDLVDQARDGTRKLKQP